MFNRIDIISIPVKDQTASKKFYQDLPDFESAYEGQMGPDQVWIQLRPSGAETSITLVTWFEAMPAGSVQGLVLDTDDVEQTRSKFIKNGLDISEVRKAPWGSFATFSDPDGNGWVLQQSR
ncbi:MAG: hypothetical protein COC23_05200 [Hyphomicrobiales bacterium]|nr:MAG: hypothetical protein COC23_05200 [Hyphomicrobiales bacterium]